MLEKLKSISVAQAIVFAAIIGATTYLVATHRIPESWFAALLALLVPSPLTPPPSSEVKP